MLTIGGVPCNEAALFVWLLRKVQQGRLTAFDIRELDQRFRPSVDDWIFNLWVNHRLRLTGQDLLGLAGVCATPVPTPPPPPPTPEPPPVPIIGLASQEQSLDAIRSVFGDGLFRVAACLACWESRNGHPSCPPDTLCNLALNRASGTRGLFQIHPIHRAALIAAGIIRGLDDLYDPHVNARAALFLYRGRGGWGDWEAWNVGLCQDSGRENPCVSLHAGPLPPSQPPIRDGTLVTHAGSGGRVWVISGGRRREIVMLRTPGDVFAACGYDLGDIWVFPRGRVLAQPVGAPVTGVPCPFGAPRGELPLPGGGGAPLLLGLAAILGVGAVAVAARARQRMP